MWRTGPSAEAAFTLLEVLLVLTILSLVGTAAALRAADVRDRVRLAQAGSWLEAMLTDLRMRARQDGRFRSMEFDWTTSRYRLSEAHWRALPSGVVWSTADQESSSRQPTVTFFPDGTGTGVSIMMRAGAFSSARTVASLSGTIRHVDR